MKTRTAAILLSAGFLCLAYLASPNYLRGQARAGPITPPPANDQQTQSTTQPQLQQRGQQPQQHRDTMVGAWRLNSDQSDDAQKKLQQARQNNNGGGGYGGNGPWGGGGRMGGGVPFPGGGGGYGGGRGGMGGGQGNENRQQMQELLNPPESLTIARKDPEFDVTDDQGHKSAFFTDGRKLQKSNDPNSQEFAAHWDGDRLVSEENGARGRKITRSFELAPGGSQLYETVTVPVGRSGTPVDIRYVYDIPPATSPAQ